MYTNIDTAAVLEILQLLAKEHVIEALKLIMTQNIFQFSDTWWHQKQGTAMGTPPACMWATLYFSPHEELLHEQYKEYLLYWKQYIDDGFGIWNWTNTTACTEAFNNFKCDLNDTSLDWEVTGPTARVTYLDLTLTIQNGIVESTLYKKALNLYLYLPPGSAHPPGILKGLIAGDLLRIIWLTSNPLMRDIHICALYTQLLARGYTSSLLKPVFDTFLQKYLTPTVILPNTTNTTCKDNAIFLHLPFHPLDPKSTEVQAIKGKSEKPLCIYSTIPSMQLQGCPTWNFSHDSCIPLPPQHRKHACSPAYQPNPWLVCYGISY